MTANQQRATMLAEAVLAGLVPAADLPDHEWGLLLLASGLNHSAAAPEAVCCRVLDLAVRHAGYFVAREPARRAPLAGVGPDDATAEWFV